MANELANVFTNAGKPATLKQHASAIINASKASDGNKGKIIAHIHAIDAGELWKDALDNDGNAYKSINAYLIDALDISPAMASIYVNVGRMVVDGDGNLYQYLAPFTASQLQELLPLDKAETDGVSAYTLETAGIVPEMSCKAIRDAVKNYLATPADDEENDEAGEEENDEAGEEANDNAGTIVDFLTEIDDSEAVREWLANCPNSIVDAVSTVLYKRV